MSAKGMLRGWNARRVLFGCMSLVTGHRLFQVRSDPRAEDFQAFWSKIRRHYRGWQVLVLLDGAGSHIAKALQQWAARLDIRLLWLPKRAGTQ
jgi:hypothetical protein